MLNRVRDFIQSQQLLDTSHRYLIAVSGGADSVALLCVLQELGFQIEVCHCNFLLRGEESYRDENFVRQLCERRHVPFHLIHFETRQYASLHKMSIEMAARQLRYQYFEQLCNDLDCSAVCVAHHSDDNAETMLMNLIRGTGIRGLCGIRPIRPIREGSEVLVVRPLLCVSRIDIESWLNSIGQDYITDSTNLIDDVMRNRIRLNILPLLRQIVPSVTENLHSTAQLLTEACLIYDDYTNSIIHRLVSCNKLYINELKKATSLISVLYEWLSKYGFSSATIRQISVHLDAPNGRYWSSETHDVCIDRGYLILSERKPDITPFRIPEIGLYNISSDLQIRLTTTNEVQVDRCTRIACLDAALVKFPLTVRLISEGDRFIPYGMKGSKLLSDFLTDLKLSRLDKRSQLVVLDADGQIIWVIGRRISQLCAITPSTQTMLQISIAEN